MIALKKALSLALVALLTLALLCAALAEAEAKDIALTIDGEAGESIQGVVIDGQLYVPADAFARALGGEAEVDAEAGTISVTLQPAEAAEDDPDAAERAALIGNWHTTDGGVTVDLREDGTATLVAGSTTYAFTWYVEGDHFCLDQKGIIVQGTRDGDSMTLDIGGKLFNLVR